MENYQSQYQPDKQSEEQGFDTTLFFLECLTKWKWFVLSLVIMLGAATFYILCQVPTYRVESLILMIDKWSKSESDVLTKSLGITSGADNIYTEIEIMRSRTITKQIVNDLDLYTAYSYKGSLSDTPLYHNNPLVVRPDSTTDINGLKTAIHLTINREKESGSYDIECHYMIDQEKKKLQLTDIELPYSMYLPTAGTYVIEEVAGYSPLDRTLLVTIDNPLNVANQLSKNLKLAQFDKNTLLISASYTTSVPQKGIDIINRMVYYYNEDGVAEKNRAANNTESFINNRLIALQQELTSVEEEVERYRTQRGLTDLSSEAEMYLNKTNESDRERSKLDVQLSLIEYVEGFLSDNRNTYAPIPILGINDGGLSNLISEYNKAIAEREKLLNTSSESNPIVKEISQNILALKGNVLQGIASTRKSIELRKKDIARQDVENEQKIRSVPQYERELTNIMRHQRIKENLFVFLLEKREENALTQTLAVGDARIIDEPSSQGSPVAPKKKKIYFFAFILALAVPAGIIFIKRQTFPLFHDKSELERITNIPIMAELPHCNNNEFFVVKANSNSATSELFRLLRNNLQFTFTSPDKKVVMVTSSVSSEGKTFISSNLAISFSLTGKKVILIGLDIRRPKAATYFNISNKTGIVNYLSGQVDNIEDIIFHTTYEGLDMIPGGPIPPNPNELLLTHYLDDAIAQLRERYDYIIIDSAPVGMVSDSFLIDRVVDVNLYVTRAEYTSCNHVKALNNIVATNKLKSLYLCINDVDISTRTYSYRRYGGYGYGSSVYGYYGYNDDEKEGKKKKKTFSFLKKKK